MLKPVFILGFLMVSLLSAQNFTGGCAGLPAASTFTAAATVSGRNVTVTITPTTTPLIGQQYSIVWGDGTTTTGGASQSKTYTRGLPYSIEVTSVAPVFVIGGEPQCRQGRVVPLPSESFCAIIGIDPVTTVPAEGGRFSFSTSSGSSCTADVRSNAAWVTLTADFDCRASGCEGGILGSGETVQAEITPNTSPTPRRTSISAGGQSFWIHQAGVVCEPSFASPRFATSSAAVSGSVAVTLPAGCEWQAAATVPWINVLTTAKQTGSATVQFSLAANTDPRTRSGFILIAGKGILVTQAGQTCSYAVTPSLLRIPIAGTGAVDPVDLPSFEILTQPGCNWEATPQASWITMPLFQRGSGPGRGFVAAAPTSSARTGSIRVGNQEVVVEQFAPIVCGSDSKGVRAACGITPPSCSTTTDPRPIRLTGLTELAGRYRFDCTRINSTPANADVKLTMSHAPITSRITNAATRETEALLVVRPQGTNPAVTIGTNAWRGVLDAWNRLIFRNVSFAAFDTGDVTIEVLNLRVNGTVLSWRQPLTATLDLGWADTIPVPATVGRAEIPMLLATGSVTDGPAAGYSRVNVTVTEPQFMSYGPRLATGQDPSNFGLLPYLSESGFVRTSALGNTGAADVGTRARILIPNVTAGIRVWAPVSASTSTGSATLVSADSNGAGGTNVSSTLTLGGVNYAELAVTGGPLGQATATYQVNSADAFFLDQIPAHILLQNASSASAEQIRAGLRVALAPIALRETANDPALPIPRFLDPAAFDQKRPDVRPVPRHVFRPVTPGDSSKAVRYAVAGNKTFSWDVLNDSSQDATGVQVSGVVVRSNLPSDVGITSCARSDGGACSATPDRVEGRIDNLPAGQSVTFIVNTTGEAEAEFSVQQREDDYDLNNNIARSRLDIGGCVTPVNPLSAFISAAGGVDGVTIPECGPWTATSDTPWIRINSSPEGSVSTTIFYQVEPNPTTSRRTGYLIVAGWRVAVTQYGQCSYAFPTPPSTVSQNAGSFTQNLTVTGEQCSWTASSSQPWLTFSPASGTTAGTVPITMTRTANPGTSPRSTQVSAGTATFALTQLGQPGAIAAGEGNGQSATGGATFATVLRAVVRDAGNNVLQGITITFTAPASGASGTFANGTRTTTAVTDANGTATATAFTANGIKGTYNVAATTGSLTANFALTNSNGTAASIAATAGTPQSTAIGTAFATALQATVRDAGNSGVSGVVVTFTAPAAGATGRFTGNLATVTATTNADGVATAPAFTANTTLGTYAVTVSAATFSTTFTLTNTALTVASVAATSGTPQSATVSTAFSQTLQVVVRDGANNPVPNVTVTFTAPSSGASATFTGGSATATATTNAQGIAISPALTANATAGTYQVTATAGGQSALFTLTNTAPGNPTFIIAGNNQTTRVSSLFSVPLKVLVQTPAGVPVAGATVTFTAPAGGATGTFSASQTATALTDQDGIATAPQFTANATAGPIQVTAAATGGQTVVFNLTSNTCTYTVPAPAVIDARGARGSFTVTTAGTTCAWNAHPTAQWIQPFPTSGPGTGTIEFTVFPNFGTTQREADILVGGQRFTIRQPSSGGTPDQRFVEFAYFNALRRFPSSTERDQQLLTPLSRAQRIAAFMKGGEFAAGAGIVSAAYRVLLGRVPEKSGWEFQLDNIVRNGASQTAFITNITSSPEWLQAQGASVTDAQFVNFVYLRCLGRDASPAEIQSQVGNIQTGSRAQFVTAMLGVPEFKERTRNLLDALHLYFVILGRDPGRTELATTENALKSGTSFDSLAAAFVNSAEHALLLQ